MKMPLVEVVPHDRTNKTAVDVAMSFYKAMGKSPVLVNQECPGFVANRLQAALNGEAYSLVQRGIVSAEACGRFLESKPVRTQLIDLL